MRLKVLAAVALALAVIAFVRLALRPPASGDALATTECPFRGDPRVTVAPRVAAADTMPVRAHEEVHARQCRELGPWRYRMRNLTSAGRLELEAPAYCAGARARLAQGETLERVRERLLDDAEAAFAGRLPAERVRESLRQACADLFRTPVASP